MHDLVVLVYADRFYYKFVFPYIYFCIRSNPTAYIDVVVDDLDKFKIYSGESYDVMVSRFGENFGVRETLIDPQKVIPNTIRFLEVPAVKAKYIYIGDIDILVFENIVETHLEIIKNNSLDFSNIVRKESLKKGKPRLTGLHFSEYHKLYPHPDFSDLDLSIENDEHVLYELCRRKGNKIPVDFSVRPECGIHLSLNRDPLGRLVGPNRAKQARLPSPKWGGGGYYRLFIECYDSIEYHEIESLFNYEFRVIAFHLYGIATDKHEVLELYSESFIKDRRYYLAEEKKLIYQRT